MASRYSFSAPGSRFGLQPWFRIGNLDVTTTVLVAGLALLSMFVWAIDQALLDWLVLWADDAASGEVWRVVTWPLANAPDFWTIITIAIFWYFGSEVEGRMGRNRYAVFLVVLAVVPGVVGFLLEVDQAGIEPIELAVLLVFILEYPHARFFFGIPGWVIGAVIVGLQVLQLMGLDQNDRLIVLFVSLATGAIMARTYGLAQSLPWIPALPLPASRQRSRRGRRSKPTRRRSKPSGPSRVVEGPWDSSARPGPMPRPPSPEPSPADQAELDDLLDKINAGGIDSLSSSEKRRLNELSKRLRDG